MMEWQVSSVILCLLFVSLNFIIVYTTCLENIMFFFGTNQTWSEDLKSNGIGSTSLNDISWNVS
jgi:hypothetical protein